MPTDLSTLNLSSIGVVSGNAINFFNDTLGEQSLVTQIQTEGNGFYKLKQLKTGEFIEATKVTEISEDIFIIEYGDRVIVDIDPDFIYMYVHLT